jgi:hypothetical protein
MSPVMQRLMTRFMADPRRMAQVMLWTGILRVALWAALIILYLADVERIVALYDKVSFVAVLSVLALLLTDWSQCAASMAQLTAASSAEPEPGDAVAEIAWRVIRDVDSSAATAGLPATDTLKVNVERLREALGGSE